MWLTRVFICTLALALNMATIVQSAIGEADPAVPTLAGAPTDGNLLVCIAMERSDASAVTTPSGWTLAFERYPQQGNPSNRRSLVCFYRIASGDSTTPISVDFNSTGTIKAILAEFALDTGNGEDQWILDAVQSNDNGTTADAQTLSSGTTASVSGTRFLIIGALGYREGTGGAHLFTSWTNDVNDEIHSSGGTNGRNMCLGYGTRTTAGTQETTATWNMQGGTNSGATTGIVVFDLVAAAVPSVGTTGLEDNQVYPPYALQGGGIRPPINSTGKLFRPGPGGGGLSRLRSRPKIAPAVTHFTGGVESSTEDGTGAASGTGTAAAIGASTAASTAASAGIGAGAGVSASTAESGGTASGIGEASGIGAATAAANASTAGTGTATGVSTSTAASAGDASGTGNATGIAPGGSTESGDGAASGTGTAAGVGTGVLGSTAAASGTGSASAVAAPIGAGIGAAGGTGLATGTATSTSESIGIAAGAALVIGVSGNQVLLSIAVTDSLVTEIGITEGLVTRCAITESLV